MDPLPDSGYSRPVSTRAAGSVHSSVYTQAHSGFGLVSFRTVCHLHCWNAVRTAWLRTASHRLRPSPRPQIIGPIHLGAGNLHTTQEVMDGSSKPVCLSRAQLSISVGCEAICLSVSLLVAGQRVPSILGHPRLLCKQHSAL